MCRFRLTHINIIQKLWRDNLGNEVWLTNMNSWYKGLYFVVNTMSFLFNDNLHPYRQLVILYAALSPESAYRKCYLTSVNQWFTVVLRQLCIILPFFNKMNTFTNNEYGTKLGKPQKEQEKNLILHKLRRFWLAYWYSQTILISSHATYVIKSCSYNHHGAECFFLVQYVLLVSIPLRLK